MTKLRIPTLQHLARNWEDTPEKVEKALLEVVNSTPPFNYNILNTLVFDHLKLNVARDELKTAILLKEKRESVRKNFLEVLAFFCSHFEDIRPDYVHQVTPRYYPLHRNLKIEFRPPLLYGIGGQIYFPWFSYWKSKALSGEQLSLFVTLVYEMLLQDPDLEQARFQILDFSADSPNECRQLRVIEAAEVPRISEARKNDMLTVFWEGYQRAEATLFEQEKSERRPQRESIIDENQLPLLD